MILRPFLSVHFIDLLVFGYIFFWRIIVLIIPIHSKAYLPLTKVVADFKTREYDSDHVLGDKD